jgi:hypothetical protein
MAEGKIVLVGGTRQAHLRVTARKYSITLKLAIPIKLTGNYAYRPI